MSSYTPHQYELQHQVMLQVRWAGTSNTCPVCRARPRGVWPDGVQRIICGDPVCFRRWLPVRQEKFAR